MRKSLTLLFIIAICSACKKSPDINADMLGGGTVFDPATYQPEKYLLSVYNPTPTAIEAQKPVVIACHGYSASTFEWDEFKEWSKNRTDYYISQVLLNGHGRTYDDFKKSTWHDWQSSITEEYNKLVKAGYKKINFATSSTSCTLILDMLSNGFFNNAGITTQIFLIDPIIIPSEKNLSLIGIFGPLLGYLEADNTTAEDKYYYHYRPQETLQQLQELLTKVRKELEGGIILSPNITLKVYKSKQDPTADPVSAVLIYNGIKTSQGNSIDLQMVDSKLHVFTRLALRSDITALDRSNQTNTFTEITTRILR